jgi:hypothetical protein
MTRRVVLNYLAVDLLFEAEIALGFSYVSGLHTTAERVRFFVEIAIGAASTLTPFLISLAVLLRPVERWIAAGSTFHLRLPIAGRRAIAADAAGATEDPSARSLAPAA